MTKSKFPDRILDDPKLLAQFKVGLSKILTRFMDVSEWTSFALLYDLESWMEENPRFMTSAQWQNEDHGANVIALIDHLIYTDVSALEYLIEEIPVVRRRLDDQILMAWDDDTDPMLTALTHSLSQLEEARHVVDLGEHISRVEGALPGDPQAAVGATKDLLEAAMRTIIDDLDVEGCEKLDFPALTNTCFENLGLLSKNPPNSAAEAKVRKIADSARKMLIAANELRNLAGTGHGHVIGKEEELTADDASLVASSGMILAAWLLRRADAE